MSSPDLAPSRDIQESDLHATLTAFYDVIAVHPMLRRYFESIDMSTHMPRIEAFWSTLLFHTRRYTGNAFRPHLAMPDLEAKHFAFWVQSLEAIVDSRFAGPAASLMKDLAHRIAYSMQVRLGITPFESFRAAS